MELNNAFCTYTLNGMQYYFFIFNDRILYLIYINNMYNTLSYYFFELGNNILFNRENIIINKYNQNITYIFDITSSMNKHHTFSDICRAVIDLYSIYINRVKNLEEIIK